MNIGINPDFDYLYDPQQAEPAGWCPCCGAEIYGYGRDKCKRCEAKEEE